MCRTDLDSIPIPLVWSSANGRGRARGPLGPMRPAGTARLPRQITWKMSR